MNMKEINYDDIKKNTILYGPPGTGKTYNTVNYAVTICDRLSEDEFKEKYPDGNREELKQRFDELKAEGRIEFVTFHQSYGYEDFVEGIRPVLNKDSKDVSYELHEGIFKKICESASKETPIAEISDSEENNKKIGEFFNDFDFDRNDVWLAVTYENLKEQVINNNIYSIQKKSKYDNEKQIEELKKGDIVFLVLGRQENPDQLLRIGRVMDDPEDLSNDNDYLKRKVNWYKDTDFVVNCFEVAFEDSLVVNVSDEIKSNLKRNNYALIIDEINRGNISKIFGELITLIEDSKRAGTTEALTTTLPYSNSQFSVPKNLYLIGTMNTADRSLAMMDAALRRRFDFVEMLPDSDALSDITIDGINIKKLLDVINKRISYLYDNEHLIGHAFFTSLLAVSNPKIEDLDIIFRNSVIPMLLEYFYGDHEKVSRILGGAFIKEKSYESLEELFPEETPTLVPQYTLDKNDFGKPSSYQRVIDGMEVEHE